MSEKNNELLTRLTDPDNFGMRLRDLASAEELLTLRTDYYALKTELQVAQNELEKQQSDRRVDFFINFSDMEALRLHANVLWLRLHARASTKTAHGYKYNIDKEFFRVICEKLLKLEMAGLT